MKRKSCYSRDPLLSLFDDDEMEVSVILLQIPRIIFESENCNRFLFTWGVRKRRSAIDPSLSLPSVPTSSSTCLSKTCVGLICDDNDLIANVEASSPTTSLSISTSESNGRSKRFKRSVSYEMKKEDQLKMVEGLTQRKDLLKMKMESIERFYNMLIAHNSELKAKTQQLSVCIEKEMSEARVESREQAHSQPLPLLPLLLHHPAYGSEMCGQTSALVPSAARSGVANPMGPPAIPDLNASPKETIGPGLSPPLDLNLNIGLNSDTIELRRAAATQARKKRLQIYKMKKPKSLPRTNQFLKLGVTC